MDQGDSQATASQEVVALLDLPRAREAVARHARVTPLLPAPGLTEAVGRPVLVKAECLQHTGSFKIRGAAARLEALDDDERARGVVACSSGNHGRAVSFVAGRLGIPATVYVPEWVDPTKLEGIRAGGAEAVRVGETFDEAEALALERAKEDGLTYVSAYDDPWIIAGQGTLAFEIAEQLGSTVPGALVVPLSGGGLIGGIAAALPAAWPVAPEGAGTGPKAANGEGDPPAHEGARRPACLAASAENAAVMLASVREGRPVELPEEETLANALAGGIGLENRYSFRLVRDRVDAHATVGEDEIAEAMRHAMMRLHLVVEGGGAVGLASLLAGRWDAAALPPGPLVVVLSGGNVAAETLARVLRGEA